MNKRNQSVSGLGNAGKMPPSNPEVEKAVLGAILIEQHSLLRVFKDFKPDIFYKEEHFLIADAVLSLHNQSRKIDLMTVVSELQIKGKLELIGGLYYLTELTDRVVSSAHLEEHLEIIKSHWIAREQIKLYSEKVGELYSLEDPYESANAVSNKLISLQEDTYIDNEFSMQDLALQSIKAREEAGKETVDFIGYSTGINALDRVLMGIKQPDLTIIAGRPAMGKTAVALTIARNLATQVPVTLFSLEMSASQLYNRILSSESNVRSKLIKTNNLTDNDREKLTRSDHELSELPLIINDTPALNIDRFRSIVMIHKRKYGTGAVIIDYLGLMKGNTKGFGNSTAEVTEITGKLKRVAKEMNIPIILLAQLSRGVEGRKDDDFKPKLSDLRDSGSIEQDADNVVFLWRPEYYGLSNQINIGGYAHDPKGLLVFIVAKCRDGETKNVPASVDLSKMQVRDYGAIFDPFDPRSPKGKQEETLPF